MEDWSFVVTDVSGDSLGELSAATGRKITWPLDAGASAEFSLPGTHPQASLVVETETDLIVYDGIRRARFRGRMGSSSDDVSADGHTAQFSAVDYRGFLDRRTVWPTFPLTYTSTEQVAIAWDMIHQSQLLPGGDLGITDGSLSTGILRDQTLQAGTSIAQSITGIGDLASGFDWEVDPALVFKTYYPERGIDPGLTLAYGAQILSFKQTKDTSTFATAIRYSGDSSLTPQTRTVSTFGPAGRWELQVGDPNILVQAILDARADWELDQDQVLTPTYEVVLKPGWWTPDLLWLGDTVTLVLKSGHIDVNGQFRVIQVEVDLGDDGGQTVTLTFGTALTTQERLLRRIIADITASQRR